MKKIKAIGFDMDYTIVRYNSAAFESYAHQQSLKKLVEHKGYPKIILKFEFEYERVIQGLVLDKKRGNLIQLSRYGKAKTVHHGLTPMNYQQMQEVYRNRVIDLNDPNIQSLDTNFSVSNGIMFAQLVDLKDKGGNLPSYSDIADDIREAVDMAHADGTLKQEVARNIEKYIIREPEVAELLERYKSLGKKLLVITNSDYSYSKLLLDYCITPYLKNHKCWSELFEITVTLASKPRFFTQKNHFLSVDPKTGLMSNVDGQKITPGIYQGGHAGKLQRDLNLEGDEILYLGDHIFGDVVAIKKTFNWRTALVLDPLAQEIEGIKKTAPIQERIDELMEQKQKLESDFNKVELKKDSKKEETQKLFEQIDELNQKISDELEKYKSHFNPYWGQMMRSGQEESRFADQVEKYACIYMTKIADLLSYSPRTYFRPRKRILPHEIID